MPRLTVVRNKQFTASALGFAQINFDLNQLRNSSTLRQAIKEASDGRISRWIMEKAGEGMTIRSQSACKRDMLTY